MSFDAIPEDLRESHPCDCGDYGNFYMDSGLWMTMVETKALLKIIDSFDTKDNI